MVKQEIEIIMYLSVFLIFAFICLFFPSMSSAETIIIDHTCTNLEEVQESWINHAKAMFKLSYGHTSHGSQIITGMDLIKGVPGSLYWFDHNGTSGGLSLHDCEPSGDLGNPDRTTWAARTRELLDSPENDRNMIMWSWCGQADTTEENMQIYLDLMTQLEIDYPDVTFIYMTGHLNGTGEEGNLNQRNNQIRAHCMEQGKNRILFDFADIESYDPDGNYFLDLGANDGCYYWIDGVRYNWADEWCAANPGKCEACDCAHSHCLNCQLKGRAFWWMMARLAGWNPDTMPCKGDFNNDGSCDAQDWLLFGEDWGRTDCFSPPPCECDINQDGRCDMQDWLLFGEDWGRTDCPTP